VIGNSANNNHHTRALCPAWLWLWDSDRQNDAPKMAIGHNKPNKFPFPISTANHHNRHMRAETQNPTNPKPLLLPPVEKTLEYP
jgi:hypothetical protein